MHIELTLEHGRRRSPLRFEYSRMVNAGYTGRNQEEVRKHIEELAAKGIPGPETTPTLYPVIARTLVADPLIEVYGEETSGEAEYVLLVADDETVYVGVGSDHTDRHLEETDIPRSKQVCPNVLHPVVWRLDEVEPHWDDLRLRSTVTVEGRETRYQEGPLGNLMSPRKLLDFVRTRVTGPLAGTVIYSGTLGTLEGGFLFGERFAVELEDPRLERRLSVGYDVRPLDYVVEA